jgi:hypothetical protein
MALSKPTWVAKPQDRRIATQYFRCSDHSDMYVAVGVYQNALTASVRQFLTSYDVSTGDQPITVIYTATQNGCPVRDTELVSLLNFAPEITRCVGGVGPKPDTALILKAAAERSQVSDGGVVRQLLTPDSSGTTGAEKAKSPKRAWVSLLTSAAAAEGAARYPSKNGEAYVVALERAHADYPKFVCLTRSEWLGLQVLLPLAIQYCQYVNTMLARWGLAEDGTSEVDSAVDLSQWSAVRCQAHLLYCLHQVLADQLRHRPNMSNDQLVCFANQIQHGDVFQRITAGRVDRQNFSNTEMFDRCNDLLATGAFQGEALVAWFRSLSADVIRDVRTAIQTGEGDFNAIMTGKPALLKKPPRNRRKQQTAAEVAEEMMSGDEGGGQATQNVPDLTLLD